MIPLKNFDDKKFLQLLEEARSLIHRYSDEWTDENYHDPGITFLEMLTWLTEMQRFYLSRISDVSMSQLIELMGYLPKGSTPAKGVVELRSRDGAVFLPTHTQLRADEQVFETRDYIDVVASSISHIFNFGHGEIVEQTQHNNQQGMHYLPFGEHVEAGELWVLMLDKPLPKEKTIQFYIDIYDGYAVGLKDTCQEKHGIGFEVFSSLETHGRPLQLFKDETLGFMKSGVLRFQSPADHKMETVEGVTGYPIVIRVKEDYDLLSPQFNKVFLNAVTCFNIDHQVQTVTLEKGSHTLRFELAFVGNHLLQVQSADGWVDVSDEDYSFEKKPDHVKVTIHDDGVYQMIFWRPALGENTVIGSTTGFPDGMIRYSSRQSIVEQMTLQCATENFKDKTWSQYDYTASFLKHDAKAKVFSVDSNHEFLFFGNHEHGYLPEQGHNNVRLTQLQLSNFERGNIKAGRLQEFGRDLFNRQLDISNPYDFYGGKRKDNKEKVLQDVLKTYEHKQSLVTANDYLNAVKDYPDARILFANAYGDELVDNRIKLTAVPYTGERFPKISDPLKKALMAYVDQYRMITTSIEFVEPVYIEVSVFVDLTLDQPRLFNHERVQETLYDFFNPIQGYEVMVDYQMGTLPSKSDIMAILLKMDGVGGIKRLEIDISGGKMPKHGVIYTDRIQISYDS